jgi:hypothetical protein
MARRCPSRPASSLPACRRRPRSRRPATLAEIKHDGFRVIARKAGSRIDIAQDGDRFATGSGGWRNLIYIGGPMSDVGTHDLATRPVHRAPDRIRRRICQRVRHSLLYGLSALLRGPASLVSRPSTLSLGRDIDRARGFAAVQKRVPRRSDLKLANRVVSFLLG